MLYALSMMALDAIALSAGLLFVVIGVWSLRKRFQKHEEWPLRVQMFMLAGVLGFYLIEITILRVVIRENVMHFIFALLGLLVAGAALYGHIAVSVVSRLMVELLVPDNPAAATTPRLGPAEALERQGNWEGALNEYYILARIYPRNPMLCVRAANNLLKMNRCEEAVAWFERAIKYADKADDNLAIVRRLCDVLESLEQHDRANEALRLFTLRFADHDASREIAAAIERGSGGKRQKQVATPVPDGLVSLEDDPIRSEEE